jgi:TPP-dependent pyruvate/acetoin dehydrogenase alpha subunit
LELENLRVKAEDEIAAAVEFAISSPEPAVDTLWEDVYA